MRVAAILERYPQMSETYISTELGALWPRHDISVIALNPADLPVQHHHPYKLIKSKDEKVLIEVVRRHRPEAIHGHYFHQIPLIHRVSEALDVPYTIRTHSYDVLARSMEKLQSWSGYANSEKCLGILAFPFIKEMLVTAGIKPEKIHDCFPVVDFEKFYNRDSNLPGVMNVGAALPKKFMTGYLQMAARIEALPVRLYAVGYNVKKLRAYNDALGHPAEIIGPIEFENMPMEYKRHTWLVYSASRQIGTVGWPIALAEAQASGVGVCIEGIRPDLRDYVGSSGILLNSLEDALEVVSEPPSQEIREAGFEQARLSDVARHIGTLERLWT